MRVSDVEDKHRLATQLPQVRSLHGQAREAARSPPARTVASASQVDSEDYGEGFKGCIFKCFFQPCRLIIKS